MNLITGGISFKEMLNGFLQSGGLLSVSYFRLRGNQDRKLKHGPCEYVFGTRRRPWALMFKWWWLWLTGIINTCIVHIRGVSVSQGTRPSEMQLMEIQQKALSVKWNCISDRWSTERSRTSRRLAKRLIERNHILVISVWGHQFWLCKYCSPSRTSSEQPLPLSFGNIHSQPVRVVDSLWINKCSPWTLSVSLPRWKNFSFSFLLCSLRTLNLASAKDTVSYLLAYQKYIQVYHQVCVLTRYCNRCYGV